MTAPGTGVSVPVRAAHQSSRRSWSPGPLGWVTGKRWSDRTCRSWKKPEVAGGSPRPVPLPSAPPAASQTTVSAPSAGVRSRGRTSDRNRGRPGQARCVHPPGVHGVAGHSGRGEAVRPGARQHHLGSLGPGVGHHPVVSVGPVSKGPRSKRWVYMPPELTVTMVAGRRWRCSCRGPTSRAPGPGRRSARKGRAPGWRRCAPRRGGGLVVRVSAPALWTRASRCAVVSSGGWQRRPPPSGRRCRPDRRGRARAGRLDCAERGGPSLGVAADQVHGGAQSGQGGCRCQPDARGRAGDHHRAAFHGGRFVPVLEPAPQCDAAPAEARGDGGLGDGVGTGPGRTGRVGPPRSCRQGGPQAGGGPVADAPKGQADERGQPGGPLRRQRGVVGHGRAALGAGATPITSVERIMAFSARRTTRLGRSISSIRYSRGTVRPRDLTISR